MPTFRAVQGSGNLSGASAGRNQALPAGVVAGDACIIFLCLHNGTTLTCNTAGWDLRDSRTVGVDLQNTYTKTLTQADIDAGTVSFSYASAKPYVIVLAFAPDAGKAISGFVVAGQSNPSGNMIAPSVTPSAGFLDDMLAVLYSIDTSAATGSTPAGMTPVNVTATTSGGSIANNATALAFYQQLTSGAATGTRTSVPNTADTNGGVSVLIEQAAAAAPPSETWDSIAI